MGELFSVALTPLLYALETPCSLPGAIQLTGRGIISREAHTYARVSVLKVDDAALHQLPRAEEAAQGGNIGSLARLAPFSRRQLLLLAHQLRQNIRGLRMQA